MATIIIYITEDKIRIDCDCEHSIVEDWESVQTELVCQYCDKEYIIINKA